MASPMVRLAHHLTRSFTSRQVLHSFRAASTSSREYVDYTVKGDVAVVKFNNPKEKMNSLGEQVSAETQQIITELYNSSNISSIVIISGKTDNFIVGADIKMLQKCSSVAEGEALSKGAQEMLQRLADSPKPIVAAIMGPCLGGGLEVAMACHYRIAVKDRKTVLGVPEVMLGLLPGAGGTQRLPQLVNIPEALQMMLTGKQTRADKAMKIGLVDQLVDLLGPGLKPGPERTLEYLEEVAIETARQLANGKLKPKRKRPLMETLMKKAIGFGYIRNMIFDKARATVTKQTKGLYPAPFKILDAVKTGLEKGSAAGYEAERKGFGVLTQTPESKALIGLFHGQTQCKKNRFGKPKKEPMKVGVLGAGLMGAGIATVSVKNGHQVVMKDANMNGLVRGELQLRKSLDDGVKKKKMTSFEKDKIMSNLLTTLDYNDLKDSDIIIEAVLEDLKVKHKVIQEIEAIVRPDCIFASNTSALPIADIAKASKRPENVVGMHYFSPVDKMPLLEVITTDKTSKDTAAAAVACGLKQGKVVITVKDSPAFYTTRILAFFMSEATQVLQECGDPKKVDALTKAMGFPVGAITLMDEVGFDTGMHISAYLETVYGDRLGGPNNKAGQEMISLGFYGRKAGKGWYLYDSGKKGGSREVNPKVTEILKKYHIPANRSYTDEELQMRMLTRFVNEAVLCLQETILENPVEGDIGAVFGLGFPPNKGGPFRYVDQYGADKIVAWMEKFRADYGKPFTPCQLLLDHAKDSSKKFHKSN